MQGLYATNDWGIFVSHDEVLNGTLNQKQLEDAGYKLINPVCGDIYFDDSGEYLQTDKPFWFLPIEQGGLFEAPYEDMNDIEAEVTPLYPEVFYNLNVAERLCRLNMVCGK